MGQAMDEYLPIMDALMAGSDAPAPTEEAATQPAVGTQITQLAEPAVHYVWETDGVQNSLEDLEALPVSVTMSYTLDGKDISVKDLAGTTGKVTATLRAERKAGFEDTFGVAAVVQMEDTQCKNLTVTGGTHTESVEKNADICMGSAWLGQTGNVYEMQMTMDVTAFDPTRYVVTINPVYVAGGGSDASLNALLATASELTAIVNDGVTLHTSMVEWHTYLTNIQTALESTGALAAAMAPEENEAAAAMKTLLADAEAEADALLKKFGYKVDGNMTAEERVQKLTDAASASKRTKAEKAEATELAELIQNYLVIANHIETTQLAATEIGNAVGSIAGTMPDLVGAYGYANDTLYGIIYKVSTLYQNLADYYATVGGGAVAGTGDWSDVIIFTNHENIVP